MGAVVGATEPDHIARLRELMPQAVFLIPGVGAQGGRPEDLGAGLRAGAGPRRSSPPRASIAGAPDPAAAAEELRAAVWEVSARPARTAAAVALTITRVPSRPDRRHSHGTDARKAPTPGSLAVRRPRALTAVAVVVRDRRARLRRRRRLGPRTAAQRAGAPAEPGANRQQERERPSSASRTSCRAATRSARSPTRPASPVERAPGAQPRARSPDPRRRPDAEAALTHRSAGGAAARWRLAALLLAGRGRPPPGGGRGGPGRESTRRAWALIDARNGEVARRQRGRPSSCRSPAPPS